MSIQPGRILVTGASGFLGAAVVAHLRKSGLDVVGSARHPRSGELVSPELGPTADWRPLLEGVSRIVHCAGRAHVFRESKADAEAAFRRVNTEGTLGLAAQAAACGVRRFVFISSIGVNGRGERRAYSAADPPHPEDAYARSKLAAEQGLLAMAGDRLEVVVIRPTMVYGPGAGGNFSTLLKAVRSGLPLPFGSFRNPRTLLGLGNLLDLIELALLHPAAAGEVFLAADSEVLSVAEICRVIAELLDRRLLLLNLPPPLLAGVAALAGQGDRIARLDRPLVVDNSKARQLLGWSPSRSTRDGMADAIFGTHR